MHRDSAGKSGWRPLPPRGMPAYRRRKAERRRDAALFVLLTEIYSYGQISTRMVQVKSAEFFIEFAVERKTRLRESTVSPQHRVMTSASSTFILLVYRPGWRIMNELAPPEPKSFNSGFDNPRHTAFPDMPSPCSRFILFTQCCFPNVLASARLESRTRELHSRSFVKLAIAGPELNDLLSEKGSCPRELEQVGIWIFTKLEQHCMFTGLRIFQIIYANLSTGVKNRNRPVNRGRCRSIAARGHLTCWTAVGTRALLSGVQD